MLDINTCVHVSLLQSAVKLGNSQVPLSAQICHFKVCHVFGPGYEQAKHSAQPPSLMISILDSATCVLSKQVQSEYPA